MRLHAIGGFETNNLTGEERAGIEEKRSWFRLGEAAMAAAWQGLLPSRLACCLAEQTASPPAVIGAVVIFLPKIIRQAVKTDTEAVIAAFGKNERMKMIFRALFLAAAGLVLA